jgi:hypothetical protein
MSKTFPAWKIDEPLFLPPMVQDFVAEDDLDPVMMMPLLLYSYRCGIYASRRIAKACRDHHLSAAESAHVADPVPLCQRPRPSARLR